VKKLAAYPITEIIIEDNTIEGFDKHKKRWEDFLFRVLHVDQQQLKIGLNYNTYGNGIVSLFLPFHKHLECTTCNHSQRIKRLKYGKDWTFKDFKYILTCPRCGTEGVAQVKDVSYRSYRDIKLIHWTPSEIDIDFNPITQESEYAYNIPEKIKTQVLRKNRRYLETMPAFVIQAIKEQRPVILNPNNIFHFKSPTPSLNANDEGWGYPPILPALKDAFYLQTMKKAQEQILVEHLVPLDILFPASSDAAANPFMMVNLSDWKSRVEIEIAKWRTDPNRKPIMPVPVGHQRIGGNGRALMLTQEIKAWSEHMIAGMNVPQEFVFGGLSWSGSSVSLRMLENQFLNYRSMHQNFLQHWLIPRVAQFMGWSEIKVHMREFKMADDMQQKQLLMSLNQMNKLSAKSLLAEFGRDASSELKIIEQELRDTLSIQRLQTLFNTDVQIESQTAQFKAQQKMQAQATPPGGMAPPGMQPPGGEQPQEPEQPQSINVIDLAESYAKKLSSMAPDQVEAILSRISTSNPQLATLIREKHGAMKGIDQKPLPELRPPRRENALI
jgi:hypothetical protein